MTILFQIDTFYCWPYKTETLREINTFRIDGSSEEEMVPAMAGNRNARRAAKKKGKKGGRGGGMGFGAR